MGSETRVGPGTLKLKTGFSIITGQNRKRSPGTDIKFPKKIFSNGRTLGIFELIKHK